MKYKPTTHFIRKTDYAIRLKITKAGGLSVQVTAAEDGGEPEILCVTEYPKVTVDRLFTEWRETLWP